MIEDELATLAERVAPPVRPDLTEGVLARLDDRAPRREGGGVPRVRSVLAGALAALAATFVLSPHVRAAAADLLGVAGIEVSWGTPDAVPAPRSPLPGTRPTSMAEARAAADFPVAVPARLGVPERVIVSDGGRVVTMTWRDGTVLLDQFDGSLGYVFAKKVGAVAVDMLRVHRAPAWWIDGPHDLAYLDREGEEVTATARLAGPTLIWDGGAGVTFRLEGDSLTGVEAAAIARSVR
jgi:hypothetical protein